MSQEWRYAKLIVPSITDGVVAEDVMKFKKLVELGGL